MKKIGYRQCSCMTLATLFVGAFFPEQAFAELYFDPSMISNSSEEVADLSRFNSGQSQLPGSYLVDIYINTVKYASRNISFKSIVGGNENSTRDNTGLVACLTVKDFKEMGVNTNFTHSFNGIPIHKCISIGDYISNAYTDFDFQRMRLDISVPQAAMINIPKGWIAPERWDEGINAGLLSWQVSGSENKGSYGDSRSQFMNLTSGVNLGAWRLRDNSTWSYSESDYGTQRIWQHLSTYAQRAIVPLRSELSLGDNTTEGDIFDPVPFRGVLLESDDNMYPDTMRGFAPTINGIASTNAQVSVSQSGNVIYRTFVAPGSFAINDLYPLSTGGDLYVTVLESDGSVKKFVVPYSSVPLLQRQGHARYSLTVGRFRNGSSNYDTPTFAQGTLLLGLPDSITVYGGAQLSEMYKAVALGSGVNLGRWGAISADITNASSTLADGSNNNGQSIRFLYGRSLISTGTTFQLAGYRFSTKGFHTLDETALKKMAGWTEDNDTVDIAGRKLERNWVNHYDLYNNKRDRMQANISQKIGDMGSIYLTGSRQTYWNNPNSTNSIIAGFSSSFGRINYTASYSYSRFSGQAEGDRTLYLSISLPLDSFGNSAHSNNAWANYSLNRDSDGNITNQIGLSGTTLEQNNMDWSLSQGYSRTDRGNGDAAVAYKGGYGSISLGYGYSNNYRQYRYGASGSAILHSNGVTLGQSLGITNVLIAAPGAAGIPVEDSTGVRTDWRGYTIMPYARMYRENRIALDVSQLDDFTDLENSVAVVVPTRGSVVRAKFNARIGLRALMTLTRNGKPLPFGTMVSSEDGNNTGLVGDEGQVYISGLSSSGLLKAQWGAQSDQNCTIKYKLHKLDVNSSLQLMNGTCK